MRSVHVASASFPPLFGDGKGCYRIHVVGNSGCGKSTLGAELAIMLGVPYISLDALFWLPNWGKTPREEFRAKVRTAIDQSDRGWVVDGSYTAKIGTIVQDEATDIIWLDPPLALYFPRLCIRTFRRLFGYTPPCSPGCPERWSKVFLSRESIIWWCLTNHRRVRKREGPLFELDGVHVGGKRRRIGGWGKELADWKESVRSMLAQQQL